MRGTRANVAPTPTGKSKRAVPFDEPTPAAAAKRPPLDLPRNADADAEARREQRVGEALASLHVPSARPGGGRRSEVERWPLLQMERVGRP